MKFFAKCLAVFIVLTLLLVLGDYLLLDTRMPLTATLLFSSVVSLVLTLIYGWVDAVFIQQRQPEV